MINIIWEFQVHPLQLAAFEDVYGSQGAWAILFKQSPYYRGTVLLKDNSFLHRYLTVDSWDSFTAFENFKRQHEQAYNDLDHVCEKLTLSEQRIGIFEII